MNFGVLIPGKAPITDLDVRGDTQLTLCIPEITSVTHITVFTIRPPAIPDGYVFAVYLQQGNNQRICIGSIHQSCHSISVAVQKYMVDRQTNYTGYVHIIIMSAIDCESALNETYRMYEKADHSYQLLNQLGEHLAEDLVKYIVSYDGIDYCGDHFVPSTVVAKWMDSYQQRIKTSSRFWHQIDTSYQRESHQMLPQSHQ